MRKFIIFKILITAFVFIITCLLIRIIAGLNFYKIDAFDFIFSLLSKQLIYILFLIVGIMISNILIGFLNELICKKLFKNKKYSQIEKVLLFFGFISNYLVWFTALLLFWVGLILNMQLAIWETQHLITYHQLIVSVVFEKLQLNELVVSKTTNINFILLLTSINLYITIVIYYQIVTKIYFEISKLMLINFYKKKFHKKETQKQIVEKIEETKKKNFILKWIFLVFEKIKIKKLLLIRILKYALQPPKSLI